MRAEQDGMMLVRADLCERLEALRRISARRSARDCADAVIGIRRTAAAYGLLPVVRLAEALERAMQHPDGAAPRQCALYLDRLYDAIGCDRLDEAASEAMMASVFVRFS
jgi:hypothetical protein